MDKKYSSNNIIKSLIWKLLERGGTQGIQFVIQIVLARLLLPEEYGIIAIVSVFISLATVFVQSGFNTALIQKKDADELDFSSVLCLSILVATILYTVIYITAPFIASFYEEPLFIPVLRVLSLTLFVGAFNSIQNAYVAKNMLFKKLFASSVGAVITSGFVGIMVAFRGGGVWALVAQQLTNQLSIALILWFTVKWRPQFLFSFKRLKSLFSYGSKLLVSGLLDTLYNNLRTLIIGRMYTPDILGFYNRGQQFPQLIVSSINGSIQSVMLPALSSQQDNKTKIKNMMRRSIVSSSFLVFPMMVGMAVVAEPLVKIVLTEKWIDSVPYLQMFCFSYALMPIHTANLQAINAMGRSDIFLKLEVFKKISGLVILAISLSFGVFAIAVGQVIASIISTFLNAYPNKQLLEYSYREQLNDIMPSFLISILMGAIIYLIKFLSLSEGYVLFLQIIFGMITYILLAKVFKNESFIYLTQLFKQMRNQRDGRDS